jgi:four helix bundle protein
MVRSYRDLIVWQLGMALAKKIYTSTESFPKSELYGLVSQLRRCSVSVPSNIAEGHARDSTKEYLHHLSIAMGSVAELETQLMLANELGYLPKSGLDDLLAIADDLGRRLRGLQKSIRAKVNA